MIWHFIGLSVVAFAWRVVAIPGAVLERAPVIPGDDIAAAAHRGAGKRAVLDAWREPRTLAIGVIALTATLSEGSANGWLAIAVVDGFDRTEAVADIVFGVFGGAMLVARLLGGLLIDRYGRVAVLVGSAASSILGLVAFGLVPSLGVAAVGTAAWGLGAGLVVPIGIAAVSGDRLLLAGRVAVVSAFVSVASFVAPPMIGLFAEVIGVRRALLVIVGALALSIVLARAVREDDTSSLPGRGLRQAVSVNGEPAAADQVSVGAC